MPFEFNNDNDFDEIHYSFKLDNIKTDGDTKTYTFKSVSAENKTKLEEATEVLKAIEKTHGFLIYKDIWDTFRMKNYGKSESMKYFSGDWKKYREYIQSFIDTGEARIKGIDANRNGFLQQIKRLNDLYERECEKIEAWQETIDDLKGLIND